jgi:hypothetical protein
MKLKTSLWISAGIVAAGAAYWYFFVERPMQKITKSDRERMKAIEIEIDPSA